MKAIERFKEYVRGIKKNDRVAIFYHAYCIDGLCACIVTSKAITKITGVKPKFHVHYTHYKLNKEAINFIKEKKITKAIFVDLSLDAYPEGVKNAERYTDILIIDHHKFNNDLNSEKTIFCHSELIKPNLDGAFYPASKLCYDLFSNLEDMNEFDWIAVVGLIGDMGYKTWKEFVDSVLVKHNLSVNKNPYRTELGRTTALLSTSKMIKGKSDVAFKRLYNANNQRDVLNDKKLRKYEADAKEELNKYVKKSDKAEVYGDLVIYELKPKYKIGSTLSTILSTANFKDKTVVVVCHYKGEDRLSVSVRDQRRIINLSDFLKKLIIGLKEATAGGHIPAAAVQIRVEDFEVFKKRLIESYKSLNK